MPASIASEPPPCHPRRQARGRALPVLGVLGVLVGTAAHAETDAMHYIARLRGIPLLDLDICLSADDHHYRMGVSGRTLGLAEFLVHGRIEGAAEGDVDGAALHPRRYVEHGRIAGGAHATEIGFEGTTPVAKVVTPPPQKERLAIPASLLPGALDGLSALTLQTVLATRAGTCSGDVRVYDGRTLGRVSNRTVGRELLPPRSRSAFAGEALHCATEAVMIAGFTKADPVPPQQEARHSSVWLAPLGGGRWAVPVRLVFDAHAFGDVSVDLDRAAHDGPACASLPP